MAEFDPDRLDALLAGLGAWLDRSELLPDDATRRGLQRRLAEVRVRRERLRSPLNIVLIGGTGVGKSSLLNALAGEPIAAVSAVRPTTQAVTTWCHEANRDALEPTLANGRVATHTRAALRDKVLVDTPDHDSLDREHAALMEAALQVADVVLWVTTAEKYADQADAAWLLRYQQGRRFAVVLTRADEGIHPSVVGDLGRRLSEIGLGSVPRFLVSTLRGDAPAADDFARLTALLETELDAKQIRAIKADNTLAAARSVVAACRAAVPAELSPRLHTWRQEAEDAYRSVSTELASRLADHLDDDPRLLRHIEYWLGFGFGGPVGALLAALYGLRAIFSPHYPRLWEVSEAPALELASTEAESTVLRDRVLAWQEQFKARAVDLGLTGAAEVWTISDPSALKAAAITLDDSLRHGFATALRTAREGGTRGPRLLGLLLNVPTVCLLVGVPLWALGDYWVAWAHHVAAQVPPWQVLALTVGLWLALVTWVAQGAVRRWTRRFVTQVGAIVGEAVDGTLRPRLLGRMAARAGELVTEERKLEELEHAAA